MLIAFEGIDGSGKGTQAARLCDALRAEGKSCALISFPRYDSTVFGKAVGDFLNGRFGTLDAVSPWLVSLLYAGDRFESRAMLLEQAETHDVVILDRYVASNVAHQGAKTAGDERAELVAWIEKIEYEVYGLPRADLTILLDLPATFAQRLIAKKDRRSYTDAPADLQEADASYLEKVRGVYRDVATQDGTWRLVDCIEGRRVRDVEDVVADVQAIVKQTVDSRTQTTQEGGSNGS